MKRALAARRPGASSAKGAYSTAAGRQDDVQHSILFQFRLSDSQSIGPVALRRLWARACGSRDVSVKREVRMIGFGKSVPVYLLCGPPQLAQADALEERLRDLLTTSGLAATFSSVRLS
ncbi:MAG: hypothetical protein NVV68_01390 [Dokdonella sp.]|nr:hypothetical protein [Dokdonella sp.]